MFAGTVDADDCICIIVSGNDHIGPFAAVQAQITNSLENRIGVKVNTVNVNVCGIVRK